MAKRECIDFPATNAKETKQKHILPFTTTTQAAQFIAGALTKANCLQHIFAPNRGNP